jgi:hypothetical protein
MHVFQLMLCMVYCACLLCCSMNLDHCMYVFHDSLLIMCSESPNQPRGAFLVWHAIPCEDGCFIVGNREEW